MSQGLAVLRAPGRYVSLECGPTGGGHGHADRLHLTLNADGIPWLCDFGTPSYVVSELPWYRSTLAHNAPRIDGRSQPAESATCDAFDARDNWGWARGHFGDVTRTVVAGPAYVVDLVEVREPRRAWVRAAVAFHGDVSVATRCVDTGRSSDQSSSAVERLSRGAGADRPRARGRGHRLRAHVSPGGVLLRAERPGGPMDRASAKRSS